MIDHTKPLLAFSVPLVASATAPSEIQWMPPGVHTITAFQSGKPVTTKVVVTRRTAEVMNTVLEQFKARGGTRPYFDFNHDDNVQAGMPTEFFWGGDDPKTGGVRARVEWSKPGAEAVTGRAFQAFSPAFLANADGEVYGAPKNMGGLVNEPAFRTIAPLLSRRAGEPDVIAVNLSAADVWNAAFAAREAAARDAIQGRSADELVAELAAGKISPSALTGAEIYQKALELKTTSAS